LQVTALRAERKPKTAHTARRCWRPPSALQAEQTLRHQRAGDRTRPASRTNTETSEGHHLPTTPAETGAASTWQPVGLISIQSGGCERHRSFAPSGRPRSALRYITAIPNQPEWVHFIATFATTSNTSGKPEEPVTVTSLPLRTTRGTRRRSVAALTPHNSSCTSSQRISLRLRTTRSLYGPGYFRTGRASPISPWHQSPYQLGGVRTFGSTPHCPASRSAHRTDVR
jgi:hypothetical protein